MNIRSIAFAAAAAATMSFTATPSVSAADISGAGATFPYPIYAKWADAYKKETDNRLNYQSIGSGGGIKQIKARTVTFGASDAPLKGDDLEKSGLTQFPMVMGGIVPVVNLDGIKPGELVIDGALHALAAGDTVTFDADLPHHFENHGKEEAVLLAIVSAGLRRS